MPIAGWGFAPALAAGNTVVLKPAELTPLTAIRLGELALEAGLPEGVFTVLPGQGLGGRAAVRHPPGRAQGRASPARPRSASRSWRGCADQVKRVTLELGGKSANIVFADADLEKAAATAPYAVFDNAGQDCCARSRILVERTRVRPVPGAARAGGQGVPGRGPVARDGRDGPADLGRAAGHRRVLCGRCRRGVPRLGARWARVLVPANGSARPRRERPALARGDLRAGGRRCCRSTTRPTRSGSPTTPSTGCPGRSGPATSAGRCGSPARSRPATCRSTRTRRCATGRPFGGFKQSGPGPRAGPRRAGCVHRRQERLHLD